MSANIIIWPSSGLPVELDPSGTVTGTPSANFPASAYYPVADVNAGNLATDGSGHSSDTIAGVGSGGRVTVSVVIYSTAVPASYIGIRVGHYQYMLGNGSIQLVNLISSANVGLITASGLIPSSGTFLMVLNIPASGSVLSAALRRLDNGQWLQPGGTWSSTFNYWFSATDSSPAIADGLSSFIGQQSGGILQFSSYRWYASGTPAVTPSTATVSGGGTQAFSDSCFDGGLVAWSATLGTINATGHYTAPAATGSPQTDTITVTGLGNTGQSATATVTIPAISASSTAFTLTGPSSGFNHNASTSFTFTPNGLYTGTVTPTMTGLAGTWSPTSLTWSGTATAKTATFTPSATGSGNANGTASPTLTQPANVAYTSNPQTLGVTPGALPTSATTPEIFYGGGTFWLTTPPTFTPAGVAGVSCGTVSVISNTEAHAPITTGATTGTITWTDSTTGATVTEPVAAVTYVLSIVQGLTPGLSTVGYAVYDESGSLLESWTASGVTERGTGSGNYGAVVSVPLGTYSEIRWSVSNAAPFVVDVVNAVTPSTGSGTAYYAF